MVEMGHGRDDDYIFTFVWRQTAVEDVHGKIVTVRIPGLKELMAEKEVFLSLIARKGAL
jgi:hypothetical protein